jgi:hypothetical protein
VDSRVLKNSGASEKRKAWPLLLPAIWWLALARAVARVCVCGEENCFLLAPPQGLAALKML